MHLVDHLAHVGAWRLSGPDNPGEYSDPPGGGQTDRLTPDEKRQKTVLVVDDETEVREVLHESLAEEGYGVISVRNGVEAIRVLTYGQRLPDLILLDLMMPVMDGWEFQRKLDKNPRWKDIPVIIYSANTRVRPIKATVVLAKPCTLEQLVSAIGAHIKK